MTPPVLEGGKIAGVLIMLLGGDVLFCDHFFQNGFDFPRVCRLGRVVDVYLCPVCFLVASRLIFRRVFEWVTFRQAQGDKKDLIPSGYPALGSG